MTETKESRWSICFSLFTFGRSKQQQNVAGRSDHKRAERPVQPLSRLSDGSGTEPLQQLTAKILPEKRDGIDTSPDDEESQASLLPRQAGRAEDFDSREERGQYVLLAGSNEWVARDRNDDEDSETETEGESIRTMIENEVSEISYNEESYLNCEEVRRFRGKALDTIRSSVDGDGSIRTVIENDVSEEMYDEDSYEYFDLGNGAGTGTLGRADGAPKHAIRVAFVVRAEIELGQTLFVSGSVHGLGNWDEAKAVQLSTGADTYPYWRATLTLPCSMLLTYKFFKKRAWEDEAAWEDFPDDRRAVLPGPLITGSVFEIKDVFGVYTHFGMHGSTTRTSSPALNAESSAAAARRGRARSETSAAGSLSSAVVVPFIKSIKASMGSSASSRGFPEPVAEHDDETDEATQPQADVEEDEEPDESTPLNGARSAKPSPIRSAGTGGASGAAASSSPVLWGLGGASSPAQSLQRQLPPSESPAPPLSPCVSPSLRNAAAALLFGSDTEAEESWKLRGEVRTPVPVSVAHSPDNTTIKSGDPDADTHPDAEDDELLDDCKGCARAHSPDTPGCLASLPEAVYLTLLKSDGKYHVSRKCRRFMRKQPALAVTLKRLVPCPKCCPAPHAPDADLPLPRYPALS